MCNPVLPATVDDVLPIEYANSLDQAAILSYDNSLYTFQSSPWFIDVKNRFRIFEFRGLRYIAKKTQLDKARAEIEKSQQAFERLDGKSVEGRIFRIIVPTLVACDESTAYIVSEYVGTDLNGFSYMGGIPQLAAQQYVHILQFFLEHGIVHPGFLPRNLVEKGTEMYLFDWEDGQFFKAGDSIKFDRLWHTNFILNWSYLFPKEELEEALARMRNGATLIEPPLVRYERTFKGIAQLYDSSISYVRDVIEQVVFGAELPVTVSTSHDMLRPNDLGQLFADIFFDEMDVMSDMASKVVRDESEDTYAAIGRVISRIISLCRKNELVGLQYYAVVGVLLLVDFRAYSNEHYTLLAKATSFAELTSTLIEANAQSLATEFVTGTLREDRLDGSLRASVEAATGVVVPKGSEYLAYIGQYIAELREDA